MASSEEIIREVLNAHHDVVNAEIEMARDEDSPMHFSWASRKADAAEIRFREAIRVLREHLERLEG